jgi:hypothetical protein
MSRTVDLSTLPKLSFFKEMYALLVVLQFPWELAIFSELCFQLSLFKRRKCSVGTGELM